MGRIAKRGIAPFIGVQTEEEFDVLRHFSARQIEIGHVELTPMLYVKEQNMSPR